MSRSKYTKELLSPVVLGSFSISEVLGKLGFKHFYGLCIWSRMQP